MNERKTHQESHSRAVPSFAASAARQRGIRQSERTGNTFIAGHLKAVHGHQQRKAALHPERFEGARLDKQRHVAASKARTGGGIPDSAYQACHETAPGGMVGTLLAAAGLRPAHGHHACGLSNKALHVGSVKQNVLPPHGNTNGPTEPPYGNTKPLVLPPHGSIRPLLGKSVLPPHGGYLDVAICTGITGERSEQ